MKVNLFIFFRGIIKRARVVNIQPNLYELGEPTRPEGISNRHWNILPYHIRQSRDWMDMLAYIEGWESPQYNHENSYHHSINLTNVWRMGRNDRLRRMNRHRLRPTDVEYYHTDDFMFIDVTEVRNDYNDGRPYKVMLYRHIEDGNTIEGERIYNLHPMWNFPDVM